jgi:hypothetical protein
MLRLITRPTKPRVIHLPTTTTTTTINHLYRKDYHHTVLSYSHSSIIISHQPSTINHRPSYSTNQHLGSTYNRNTTTWPSHTLFLSLISIITDRPLTPFTDPPSPWNSDTLSLSMI